MYDLSHRYFFTHTVISVNCTPGSVSSGGVEEVRILLF